MWTLNKDLGIHLKTVKGGRREFAMDIGLGVVRAVEIPSRAISTDEWQLIQLARNAYLQMWGGDSEHRTVGQDPFDGFEPDNLYQTFHYIGQVDIPDIDSRIITMRKVSLSHAPTGAQPPPPDDATFWMVKNIESGQTIPLWDMLMNLVALPSQVAAISRTGTYPYGMGGRTPIEQERNAIAFAAIQVLATQGDSHTYVICQLCREFQSRVHSINVGMERHVTLDFARTEETLNLPPEWQVKLNNNNPAVQEVKTFFPGYWVDGKAAARIMRELFQNGTLTYQDLRQASKESSGALSIAENGNPSRIDELIDFFTKPRHFKHMIPVIKKHDSLRHKLIHEAADRPYSSTLVPGLWRQSALKLLSAAKKKYTFSALY